MKRIFFLSAALIILTSVQCKKEGKVDTDNSLNIFSIQDDIEIGQNIAAQIESDPSEFPIVDSYQYPAAYNHLYEIRDKILNTGLVSYTDQFEWKMTIIQRDDVINAFALPGGYIYFYTGLIKFLDNEAQFAGVMAHEMAHIARRHSTDQLTKAYGIEIILAVILGDDASYLAQIAAGLAAGLSELAFSRSDENEADEYAVTYLYATDYNAPSLADFFTKLGNETSVPTFLSTHPNPDNRIENINTVWEDLGGENGLLYESEYQQFINDLP